jgi:hypothetical protein
MEAGWITTLVLSLLLVWQFTLYRRGMSERNALTTFALINLLDEKSHEIRKKQLRDFIGDTDAKDAMDLSMKVLIATARLANETSADTTVAVHGLLWDLKKNMAT